ncbi:MAG: DUF192 domain-containing protein [Woeseia sp.]
MNGRAGRFATCAFGVLATLSLAAETADDAVLDEDFERHSIVIEAGESACYQFDVYLALTPEQQRRGLMHVKRLPEFSGMLFVYRADDIRSMWMKNTYIPLDMLFIHSDGEVESIAAMTEPLSLQSVSSSEPVRYVLELNGGITARLGIDTASIVHLPEDFERKR